MNIVDTILNGGLPEELVSKPPFTLLARKIPPYVYVPDPLLDVPSDEVTRFRTIFFRVLVQDQSQGAPIVHLIERLKATCRDEVASRTSLDTRRAYWKAKLDAEREESEAKIREDLQRDLPKRSPESIYRMASQIAVKVFEELALREPTQLDYTSALREASETLKENEAWLVAAAEELAYQLRVHTLPHQWLSNRLIWEAKNYLDEVKSRTLGLEPYSTTPAWRSESSLEPERPRVIIQLYADEAEDVHQRKIDQARTKVRDQRKKHRGRKTWDGTRPSDELLLRMLYLHFMGASYQQLVISHSSSVSVHTKTLALHLRQMKGRLFSGDDEPVLRGSEITARTASFPSFR